MRVKICGMRSAEDIALCVRAGADALGFIFTDGPRRLTVEVAAVLTARVPAFVTVVGVFADAPDDLIRAATARCRVDVLQFCGDEAARRRGSFGKPTIAVIRDGCVPDAQELTLARAVAVMLDARAPDGGARGGTGVRVSPDEAARARRAVRADFILAGGLTPANVGDAIESVRPDAVDVSSGVELRGQKDARLVRAFVLAAKEAAHART